MKKTIEYAGFAVALVMIVAAVLTYVAPHFGWQVDTVLSGSMEPELEVGSLVVTRPVPPEMIKVGDVITFRQATANNELASHRVIGIFKNSPICFETKGDANDKADPVKVPARDLVGKICLHIPMMGFFVEFLKTPTGFLFGVVIPGLIVTFLYCINVVRALRGSRDTG
jgi:signal peptidase